MSQHMAVLAAHAVARQLDPAGILKNSIRRPGSACRRAGSCSDSSECSDADTAAAAVTHASPVQRSLGLGKQCCHDFNHIMFELHALLYLALLSTCFLQSASCRMHWRGSCGAVPTLLCLDARAQEDRQLPQCTPRQCAASSHPQQQHAAACQPGDQPHCQASKCCQLLASQRCSNAAATAGPCYTQVQCLSSL
jgi:hypothetical protein